MCGIVGLFLKNSKLESQLGMLIGEMLIKMTDRGPDSAGLALYSRPTQFDMKLTLKFDKLDLVEDLESSLAKELQRNFVIESRGNHLVLKFEKRNYDLVCKVLAKLENPPRVLSEGGAIEIFKEVGSPAHFIEQFEIKTFQGTHGIGHTRMATESAVTTMGAHPFSTGSDQCLVHNGSLSNHNSVRRELVKNGMQFETDNDSEVAASYLSDKMLSGMTLRDSLNASLDDLDGFFTFVVGTKEGFGVLRDRIACKPAVLAETNDYVAFGSEYRVLTNLPNIIEAKVWEPEPATVYFWEHDNENF